MPRTIALTWLAGLGASALLAGGCQTRPPSVSPEGSAERAPAGAVSPAPATTSFAVPERVRHAARVIATGTLKARQASALAMSVPGTLLRVSVKRGQEVKEGAVLAVLEDGAAAAARRQAEAGVSAARTQLALAEDGFARVERLRQDEGASEAQLFQARAQRDLARAQLAGAEAQLEQARVNLAHHVLVAPFAGVVTQVPEGVGVTVAPGVPLVTLVSVRDLVLETSLSQEEAAGLRLGVQAAVTVPASGARSSHGSVSVIVPAVDRATNRVPVEISVPNADGRFIANAYARAELALGMERDAYRVPAAALVQREGGYAVWVAGKEGTARSLTVQLLTADADVALVLPPEGAWPEGLRVISAPPLGLTEGTPVTEERG